MEERKGGKRKTKRRKEGQEHKNKIGGESGKGARIRKFTEKR